MSEHDSMSQAGGEQSEPPSPGAATNIPLTAYQHLQKRFGEYAATTLMSTIVFFSILALLWRLASDMAGANVLSETNNRLLIVFGVLCGWVTGLFASPFTHEKGEFAELRKAIYAFVTGYFVSKVDRFLEHTLFVNDGTPHTPAWGQAALFVSAFLDAALVTFLWRRYGLIELRRTEGDANDARG